MKKEGSVKSFQKVQPKHKVQRRVLTSKCSSKYSQNFYLFTIPNENLNDNQQQEFKLKAQNVANKIKKIEQQIDGIKGKANKSQNDKKVVEVLLNQQHILEEQRLQLEMKVLQIIEKRFTHQQRLEAKQLAKNSMLEFQREVKDNSQKLPEYVQGSKQIEVLVGKQPTENKDYLYKRAKNQIKSFESSIQAEKQTQKPKGVHGYGQEIDNQHEDCSGCGFIGQKNIVMKQQQQGVEK